MARLYVICGHGEGDPGACGFGQEAERVRALGSAMKRIGGDAVELYPQGQNCYRRGDMRWLEPDAPVIELHLDSGPESARGGHVIIKDGLKPDHHDEAIAAYLKREFPGRSETIVGRTNLYNCNMAATRGINYRLVEFCFVSNQADMAKFDRTIDDIARAVLSAFGIGEEDMTNEQAKMLKAVYEALPKITELHAAICKPQDASGRGKRANVPDRLAWMAAKQEAQGELIESIDGKLDILAEQE